MPVDALAGRRVVVTRSEERAEELCERLRVLGAEPISFPVIRFEPLEAPELDELMARGLEDFDWLVLTSVNAVEHLFARLDRLGASVTLPSTAVVGEATARALRERGVEPRLVPDAYRSEALVEALAGSSLQSPVEAGRGVGGRRVLLPRSRLGRPEIARGLEARGLRVCEIALYDTVRAEPSAGAVAELRRGFDYATFTSPSSVRNFLALAERVGLARACLEEAAIACIGPVTAEEATAAGLEVTVVPERFTISALVDALVDHASKRPAAGSGAPVRGSRP